MFDIPFYTSNGEFQDHKNLKEKILKRRDEFTTDLCRFYGTGYSTIHTNSNIHIENPEIKDFLLSKQELFDPDLEVTHCWVNINPKGAYQMRHNHAECDVAGTYYLHVPVGDTGDLYMYHPAPAVETMGRIKPYWPATHCQIPREGDLYFWPGYQDHEVRTNYENQERWSISFMMSIPSEIRHTRFPSLPRPL
tara:strand:- start:2098 stop:2676 length:579 start_codon:yes stop_codon:yes gene_type:complete